MAIFTGFIPTATGAIRHYVADTAAELPTTGTVAEGDTGHAKDTDTIYRYDGTLWRPVREAGVVRDCILQAEIVSGNADFLEEGAGLTLTLEADSTNPFVYDIGGFVYRLTSDISFSVTNNAHNFIWIDNTKTLGRSALPCYYTYTAPAAPATDQHWYSLGSQQMYRWDGAAWAAVSRIFVGYVRADGGVQNGRYACEPTMFYPEKRFALFGGANSGFLDISAGTTTLNGINRYAAIVARGTANINHTAASVDALCIYAQGIIILLDSATVNLDGLGRASVSGGTGNGGAGVTGGFGGGGGGGGGGTNAGGNGGGRPHCGSNATNTTAAGGAAAGGAGGNGSASSLPGASLQRTGNHYKLQGSAGGAGGGSGTATGGNSGAGGGGASFSVPCFAYDSGVVLSANGRAGQNGPGTNRGGGGGGAGGVLAITSRNLFNSGTITATGGTGGTSGGAGSGAGGNGGAGQIVLTQI